MPTVSANPLVGAQCVHGPTTGNYISLLCFVLLTGEFHTMHYMQDSKKKINKSRLRLL